MQQFLGLVNYFRAFVPDFSRIAAPLTELTKCQPTPIPASKKAAMKAAGQKPVHKPFNPYPASGAVPSDATAAFQQLKDSLVSPPALA